MTRRRWLLVLLIAGLGLCLGRRSARAQFLSPGPLSEPHASLDGDSNCSSCHVSGRQVDDKRCLGCHRDLASRVDQGLGLHGRAYRGKRCAECHLEHNGRKGRLVRWPGGAPAKFDHTLTGWPLEGGHAGKACEACHKQKTSTGRATFLGTKPACLGCHQDFHEGRLGSDCGSCHPTTRWQDARRKLFDHAKARFPLKGTHLDVACVKCHGEPPRWLGLKFATCDACHKDPHQGRFAPRACSSCHTETTWAADDTFRRSHPGVKLVAGHAKVACKTCHDRGNERPPSKGSACVDCHSPVHRAPFGRDCKACHRSIEWLGLPTEIGREAHDKTRYKLEGRHATVGCARCHNPAKPAAQRFRAVAFDRCLACHQDRHAGAFVARGGGDCAACHTVGGFSPTLFGVTEHATTAFALEGRHQAVACAQCHAGPRPRLAWKVPGPKTCATCHANPHGEQFAAEMAKGGCASCHSPDGWSRPKIDHSTWPLVGVHATTACERCHVVSDAERRAGRGAAYRGVPRACDACHEDVHAGQFRLTAPKRTCEACHDPTTFKVKAFDHAGQARWPLEGAHAPLACVRCHPREALRNGVEAARFRLGYRACKDCHADPHVAAARGGKSITADLDCVACHSVRGFRQLAGAGPAVTAAGFDHAGTGFPLTGGHRATACTSCHHGPPPPRACAGCHRDAHEGRLGDACSDCHGSTSFRDVRALERHRRTRLPLTGMHALLECSACHQRRDGRSFSGVPADCVACHEDEYRGEIHPRHDGTTGSPAFPRACGQCHRASSWSPAYFVPGTLTRALGAPPEHELRFPIRTGRHRGLACASCHPQPERPRRVACTGCHAHAPDRLRAAHARVTGAVLGAARACLGCHPAGASR